METLGEAWQQGVTISARCAEGKQRGMKRGRECVWRADLDVTTLLATRGAPFPLDELPSRLICPRCRSRRIVVTFTRPAGDWTARVA